MLYPIADANLEVKNHEIKISHNPPVEVFIDYFGNHTGVFSVVQPHTELLIESVADVITYPIAPPADDTDIADQWQQLAAIKNNMSYMDFLYQEPFTATEIKSLLDEVAGFGRSPLELAKLLSEYVYTNFTYQKGITSVETKIDEVWNLKAGVCQDFAHILILFLRMFDIPSRYVSGYICPKDKEMRGEGATHAWVEAYIPNYGWLGLDPTNNCLVSDQHVRLAVGRNFLDCTPVKGTYKGSGEHTLEVSVEIRNGVIKKGKEKEGPTKFGYEAKNPGEPINSYRKFLDMQMQQQQ
jgi:transglutaminase-like putative cysteine protease